MTSTKRVTEAQQIAPLGVVVGAAFCCEEVTEERVNSLALKLSVRILIS